MRLIVDANIVLRTILGRNRHIARMIDAGVELLIPEAQLVETATVLQRIFGVARAEAYGVIDEIVREIAVVEIESLRDAEDSARVRLSARGQPDWPVLASAFLLDAGIWSDDRDFFGVGVPVWSTGNIGFLARGAQAGG